MGSTSSGAATRARSSAVSSHRARVRPTPAGRALFGELSAGMREVADLFVAARLLVADRDPATREPTVEVAHEALLTRWSRLVDWVDEDRRWLTQLQHLSAAARAWDDGGRPDAELYRGSRLEAAIEALDIDAASGVGPGARLRRGRASRPRRRDSLRPPHGAPAAPTAGRGRRRARRRARRRGGGRRAAPPGRRRAERRADGSARRRSRPSSVAPSRSARPSATPPRCSPSRPIVSPTPHAPARRCSPRSPPTRRSMTPTAWGATSAAPAS